MTILHMIATLLLYFLCGVQCIDYDKEALVDYDLKLPAGMGQEDFPEEIKRERIAETALWRLESPQLLARRSRLNSTFSGWLEFRASSYFEALLNMARLSDFPMKTKSQTYPNAWSMWGLQDSFRRFASMSYFKEYRDAIRGYPFEISPSSKWQEQVTSAYIMSAKMDLDLGGQFYGLPFFSINDTVRAYIALRDPTSPFQGQQGEGERILRNKLMNTKLMACYRDLRIAVAFDTFSYSSQALAQFSQLLENLHMFTPNAKITIRGTSQMKQGYPEGAALVPVPRVSGSTDVRHFDFLDLIDAAINDIMTMNLKERLQEEENGKVARALVIFSRFQIPPSKPVITDEDRIERSLRNSKRERRLKAVLEYIKDFDIAPFFVTFETQKYQYNVEELDRILQGDAWRGIISTWLDDTTTVLITRRLLRLICQTVTPMWGGEHKTIFKVHERLRIAARRTRLIGLTCLSDSCDLDIYAHRAGYVNEFYHDAHITAHLGDGDGKVLDLFSASGNPNQLDFVVVADFPCRIELSLSPN